MDGSGDRKPFRSPYVDGRLGFAANLVADLKEASGQSCGLAGSWKRGFLVLSSTAST